MPCQVTQAERDYYDDLTKQEKHVDRLFALINYVYKYAHVTPHSIPQNVCELTNILCGLCEEMNESTKDKIMYNGRIKLARELAEWWEVHQEFDK